MFQELPEFKTVSRPVLGCGRSRNNTGATSLVTVSPSSFSTLVIQKCRVSRFWHQKIENASKSSSFPGLFLVGFLSQLWLAVVSSSPHVLALCLQLWMCATSFGNCLKLKKLFCAQNIVGCRCWHCPGNNQNAKMSSAAAIWKGDALPKNAKICVSF